MIKTWKLNLSAHELRQAAAAGFYGWPAQKIFWTFSQSRQNHGIQNHQTKWSLASLGPWKMKIYKKKIMYLMFLETAFSLEFNKSERCKVFRQSMPNLKRNWCWWISSGGADVQQLYPSYHWISLNVADSFSNTNNGLCSLDFSFGQMDSIILIIFERFKALQGKQRRLIWYINYIDV